MILRELRKRIDERDVGAETLELLLRTRCECEWLDYKLTIDLVDNKSLAGLSKDILAMANEGGGFIVVGVRDKTWTIEGFMTALPIDTKLLSDAVIKSTGVDVPMDFVAHPVVNGTPGRLIYVIFVRPATPLNPHKLMLPETAFPRHPEVPLIRPGEIYYRDADQTRRVSSTNDLVNLVSRRMTLAKANGDAPEARTVDKLLASFGHMFVVGFLLAIACIVFGAVTGITLFIIIGVLILVILGGGHMGGG